MTNPYLEIVRYLASHRDHEEAAFATLSYFDGAVLARRASAPALFSVALMDETCPPSTVYAAFNAYGGPKEIVTYPYNDHEGGEAFHKLRQAAWLADTLAAAPHATVVTCGGDHEVECRRTSAAEPEASARRASETPRCGSRSRSGSVRRRSS